MSIRLRKLALACQHRVPMMAARAYTSETSSNSIPTLEPALDHDGGIKEKILQHSLKSVSEFGWTENALVAGALAAGLPSVAKGDVLCLRVLLTAFRNVPARPCPSCRGVPGPKPPATGGSGQHRVLQELRHR